MFRYAIPVIYFIGVLMNTQSLRRLSALKDKYNSISARTIMSSKLSDSDKQSALIEFHAIVDEMKASNAYKTELEGKPVYFNQQKLRPIHSADSVTGETLVTYQLVKSNELFQMKKEQQVCLAMINRLQPANIPVDKYQDRYAELVEDEESFLTIEELRFT